MADVTLTVGIKTQSLVSDVQKAIKSAEKEKVNLKLKVDKNSLKEDIKSIGGDAGTKVKLSVNRTFLASDLKKALEEPTKSKLKVTLDQKYLRDQINAAIKGIGSTDSDSVRSGSGKSKSAESSASAILSEEAKQANIIKSAYTSLDRARSEMTKIPVGTAEYNNLKNVESELNNVIVAYDGTSDSADAMRTTVNEANAEIAKNVSTTKEAGQYANTFSEKLQKFKMHLTTIASIVRAFQMLRMVVQPVVNAVTEVDTAMTQLRIVTNANNAEMEQYANNIMSVADRTAGSVKDLINSTTTFARLGYSLEESSNLAEYTQMLENVGDIDEASATSAITAIVKAYNVGAEDLESVMDKLVETGNHFPISVAELAEGMNNAGSMLAMATGQNLEQSLALLTAANTTTQNISKSSTGLRTIVARIRNVKTELDDLGETVTDAQYNDIVQALTDNGVALTDQTGNLRNTYDVLKDLSAAWKDMTESEQAALAKTLSGTRQQNVFASLMQNFSEAEGAMSRMATSEGALTKANDVYLDSIQARIQQLKNAFTEMSQALVSKGSVTFVLSIAKGLTTIISVIGKVINAIGGLKTVLPLVITFFAIFKGASIAKSIGNFINSFKTFGQMVKVGFTDGIAGAKSFATSLQGVESQAVATGLAIDSALGVIGILAAVAALIATGAQKIQEAQDRALQKTIDTGAAAGESTENIIGLYNQYTNVASTTEEVAEAQEGLAEALGIAASSFDNAGNSASGYISTLREAAISELELNLTSEREGVNARKEQILNSKDYQKALAEYTTILEDYNHLYEDGPSWDPFEGIDLSNFDAVVSHMDELEQRLLQIQNTEPGGKKSERYEKAYSIASKLKEATADYITELDTLNKHVIDVEMFKAEDSIDATKQSITELRQNMEELGSEQTDLAIAEEFRNLREELIQTVLANQDFAGSEQDAAKAVDAFLSAADGFEDFYDATEKAALGTSAIARGLKGIQDVADGTVSAIENLDKLLQENDYDTGMEKRVGYYEKLLGEVEEDNWGGKHYKALADYFNIDVSQSVEDQIKDIETMGRYFSDMDQGLFNFINDIANGVNVAGETITSDGRSISEVLKEIGVEANSETGFLQWDSSKLQIFADTLGITKDALVDLLGAYREGVPPSEWMTLPPDEAASWLEQDKVMQDLNGTLLLNRQQFDALAQEAGVDADELLSSIMSLDEYSGENIIEYNLDLQGAEDAESAANSIRGFFADTAAYGLDAQQQLQAVAGQLSLLDTDTVANILVQLDLPEDVQAQLISYLPEDVQSEVTVATEGAQRNLEDVDSDVQSVTEHLTILGKIHATPSVAVSGLGTAIAQAQTLEATLNRLKTSSPGGTGGAEHATGTRHASPGPSLLGDEYSASGRPKPELVVSDGMAYLAGIHGPVVSNLKAGDIVYTYTQTKKILGNNLNSIKGIPAFSSGTSAGRYWNKLKGSAGTFSGSNTYSNYYGTSSGSGSSGSSSSNKGDGDNWFEIQYELHNHYRKMDQETDAAYLTWLVNAWKQAYAQGVIELKDAHKYEEEAYELMKKIASNRFDEEYKEHQHNVNMGKETDQQYYSWLEWRHQTAYANNEITLEEYWKYQEEVYKKARELVNDYFNDIDKKIDMLENAGKSDTEIIRWDETGMRYVEKQIAKLRKEGKDNNDSTVQELQKTWWSYYNDRKKREDDVTKNAKSAAKELIDYRIKMLKKDLDAEKEVLNDRLKNLQDFYSKQKELLQDSYDEDKYLEEQAEKRKAVTDIEIQLAQLEYDTSAWAQKKRLELSQELVEAQKELADFEKDHAIDVAKEKLDTIQEMQEKELNDQIDAIEKTTTSEADLYQQALKDVQSGGQSLYEAMVEYNNTEGSGNPEDISEMWNDAYTALKKYMQLYGEYYKQINLSYGGDTSPSVVDTSKIDAGRNPMEPIANLDKGWQKINGKWYYGDNNGGAKKGWLYDKSYNGWFYLDSSGAMQTGWQKVGGQWYYMSPETSKEKGTVAGRMQTGWFYDKNYNGWFYLDSSGAMKTGWQRVNGKWYYLSPKTSAADGTIAGRMQTGWLKNNGKWYYLDPKDGYMYTGTHKIDGKEYKFDKSGAWIQRGYASGTNNATAGIHEINERGDEALFKTSDGKTYRLFSGGEHVFNHSATRFLYDFANAPEHMLANLISGIATGKEVRGLTTAQNISLGDIYIQGSATEKTISEIRREKRAEMDYMLKELNKLNKAY